MLVGADGVRHGPGTLPVGTYEIRADTVEARNELRGTLTLTEGEAVSLDCHPGFGHCNIRR